MQFGVQAQGPGSPNSLFKTAAAFASLTLFHICLNVSIICYDAVEIGACVNLSTHFIFTCTYCLVGLYAEISKVYITNILNE